MRANYEELHSLPTELLQFDRPSPQLMGLPSAHITMVHSLIAHDGSPYYIRLPFAVAPQRYLFLCPHIHLSGFPFVHKTLRAYRVVMRQFVLA